MVNIFSKIKSLFSKREEECKEIQSTPMKVNNVTFKDYCALVMNDEWREEDIINDFEAMFDALTDINGKSRKENARIFYCEIERMNFNVD